MDRDVEVLTLYVVEGIHMFLGGKAPLLPRQVKPDDTSLAEIDCELGHFLGEPHVPHRAEYETELDSELTSAAFQSLEHSVDHIVPVKPFEGMKNRSKTGLDIDDTVLTHVPDHLIRHTLQRLLRLHHAAGVREPFQVEREAPASRPAVEPGRKLAGVLGGEFVVPSRGEVRRLGGRAGGLWEQIAGCCQGFSCEEIRNRICRVDPK